MANRIEIELEQKSAFASEARIRQHTVLIDRPGAKGGEDTGPMGGELFLAAIGGCFMSTLLAAIRARETGIEGIRARVTGALSDAPARFTGIEMVVTAKHGDPEELRKLMEIADRGCIMMNTLRGKLEITVRTGLGESAAMKGKQAGSD